MVQKWNHLLNNAAKAYQQMMAKNADLRERRMNALENFSQLKWPRSSLKIIKDGLYKKELYIAGKKPNL